MERSKKVRQALRRVSVLIPVVALAVGCSSAPKTASVTDKSSGTIKIGYAIAITGPNNGFDGPILSGAKLAVSDINAAGGVGGRKLEIVTVDNASNLAQGATSALQAIEKGAQVVVPTCDYNYGSPGARAAQGKGVLVVGCAGDSLFGLKGIGPLTFNIDPLTTQIEGASMANYAFKEKGLRKAFLFKDMSIDYSKQVCENFETVWKQLGGTVVGQAAFSNGDASIQSQVSQLASASTADVVAMCSYLPGIGSAVKQIRAHGIGLPIVSDGGADGKAWLSAVPNLSNFYNNSVGSLSGDDSFGDLTGIGQRFVAANGSPPATDYGVIFGYSEIQLIAAALEATKGSTNGAEMAKAIEGFTNLPLAVGSSSFSPTCHIAKIQGVGIREVQGGVSKLLSRYPVDNAPPATC